MNIIFLGCTLNYGKAFNASNTKVKLIADGLIHAGAKCFIHDGLLGDSSIEGDVESIIDGIPCMSFQRQGAVGIGELKNYRKLVNYLEYHKSENDQNIGIVEFPMVHTYLLYCQALRSAGYKIAVISHEWGTTLYPPSIIQKWSKCLYSIIFGYFVDAILPISEFIIKHIEHFKKPYFKVPALADFDDFDSIDYKNEKSRYFLYCASAKYYRIVTWVIDAFVYYHKVGGRYNLTLVLSGTEADINAIKSYIDTTSYGGYCSIMRQLPYRSLQQQYKDASALLIPLDPSFLQDTARFPQKIAEYTAARRPIITSYIGEVAKYFDSSSAVICKYEPEAYAYGMLYIEKNAEKSNLIAEKAYGIGRKFFDCKQLGSKLYTFLKNIS